MPSESAATRELTQWVREVIGRDFKDLRPGGGPWRASVQLWPAFRSPVISVRTLAGRDIRGHCPPSGRGSLGWIGPGCQADREVFAHTCGQGLCLLCGSRPRGDAHLVGAEGRHRKPCPHLAHMALGQSLKSQSGRQDSNLRPSAPKALEIGSPRATAMTRVAGSKPLLLLAFALPVDGGLWRRVPSL